MAKHEDRLGPRDLALLMRGQHEDGAGPCKVCEAYTASRFGVHAGCVADGRRRWHRKVRIRLEATLLVSRERRRREARAADERALDAALVRYAMNGGTP